MLCISYLLLFIFLPYLTWLFPSEETGFLILLLLPFLSFLELPVFRFKKRELIIRLNFAGCVFPLAISGYLAWENNLLGPLCILVPFASLCIFWLSNNSRSGVTLSILESVGLLIVATILFCYLIYPSTSYYLPSVFLIPSYILRFPETVAITGFFTGSWGTFLGADLINLLLSIPAYSYNNRTFEKIIFVKQRLMVMNRTIISIGGAGIADAIFLCGIYVGFYCFLIAKVIVYFSY